MDANATKAVTADRNVYAAFTATVRTYTVRFYNGSTLLQTSTNIPYGGSASYTGTTPVDPTGDGREFEGWSPSPSNITGNTDCFAQYASALEVAEITDTWDQILAAVADGTYRSKYKVGNYKPLDLGSEGTVNMQIAGFNKDALADGSGTAAISWISKELLATRRKLNPSRAEESGNYTEGTGGIGGWEKSELRSALKGIIKPLIPEVVRNAIKSVSKTQPAVNAADESFNQTSEDDVWVPSRTEMFAGSYYVLFPDNTSRLKYIVGSTRSTWWWLRSVNSSSQGDEINNVGGLSISSVIDNAGVALGFCT